MSTIASSHNKIITDAMLNKLLRQARQCSDINLCFTEEAIIDDQNRNEIYECLLAIINKSIKIEEEVKD